MATICVVVCKSLERETLALHTASISISAYPNYRILQMFCICLNLMGSDYLISRWIHVTPWHSLDLDVVIKRCCLGKSVKSPPISLQ